MTESPSPRRARHLMDPHNPQPSRSRRRKTMRLVQVQKWVLTMIAVGVIGLHSAAMAAAPMAYDSGVPGARQALLVISGAFGMVAVGTARLIHHKSVFTPLLILGWIPATVFFFLYFG